MPRSSLPRLNHAQIKKYVLLVFICYLALSPIFTFSVSAQTSDDDKINQLVATQQKVQELQQKLQEIQGQKSSLSNTITYINTKINLSQAEIDRTQAEVDSLEKDISQLGTRIGGLEQSLDVLSGVLLERVSNQYKQEQANPLESLLISHDLTSYYSRTKYIKIAQEKTRLIMQKAENQKGVFDEQKRIKQEKQAEVEQKKKLLASQQHQLAVERAGQQQLLNETQNNETKYQQLLAQAQAELSSLKAFAVSRGVRVVPPQNSPDGWYFSQKDERWANACIGSSCGTKNEENILDVGCLISSTAMIKKKYGEDVTPLTIAQNPSYFSLNTAYMRRPWPAPSGYYYQSSGYNQSILDGELAEGRPVIVHLRIHSSDGHFVVIKSGSGGNYIMHDPIEGYDKQFSSFYSLGQIDQINILKKS